MMTQPFVLFLLLSAAASTTTTVAGATIDESSSNSTNQFHTYEHLGQTRLVSKPIDINGFYNHPKAITNRHRNLLEIGTASSSEGDTTSSFDINICNLSVDSQDIKLLPKDSNNDDAIHITMIPKFSCIEATILEDGIEICFHSKEYHLSSRECQYTNKVFKSDNANLIFDPYVHYVEVTEVTGQNEYHGLTTLEPEDLEIYLNLRNELDSAKSYRRLSKEGRHLMISTRHESDQQPSHRSTPMDSNINIWNADYYGQEHEIKIDETNNNNIILKAIANSPRVYEIDTFLSFDEIKHIQEELQESKIDRYDSSTIMENIFQRASKVFNLDNKKNDVVDIVNTMEIVDAETSDTSSKMPCNHDNKIKIHPKEHSQRIASLIIFLNNDNNNNTDESEIVFQRWQHLKGDLDTLKLNGGNNKPGHAILVYHVLNDGNLDEYSHYILNNKGKYAMIHLSDELLTKTVLHEPLEY